jgi:hypothetical protein
MSVDPTSKPQPLHKPQGWGTQNFKIAEKLGHRPPELQKRPDKARATRPEENVV